MNESCSEPVQEPMTLTRWPERSGKAKGASLAAGLPLVLGLSLVLGLPLVVGLSLVLGLSLVVGLSLVLGLPLVLGLSLVPGLSAPPPDDPAGVSLVEGLELVLGVVTAVLGELPEPPLEAAVVGPVLAPPPPPPGDCVAPLPQPATISTAAAARTPAWRLHGAL